MELGATVCRPRNPDCAQCPVERGCLRLVVTPARRVKQARFEDTDRWARGRVIASLLAGEGHPAAGRAARTRPRRPRTRRPDRPRRRRPPAPAVAPPILSGRGSGRNPAPRLPDGSTGLRPSRSGRASAPGRGRLRVQLAAARHRRSPRPPPTRSARSSRPRSAASPPSAPRPPAKPPTTSARSSRPPPGMLSKLDELESELGRLLTALRASGERLTAGLEQLQADVAGTPADARRRAEVGAGHAALHRRLRRAPDRPQHGAQRHFARGDRRVPRGALRARRSRRAPRRRLRQGRSMNELSELHRRARELADLNGIGGLLLWDQNTMMPPGGADARADQFEALERIQHTSLTDPQLGRILDELEPWAASEDPDSDDVRLIAVLKRDHEKAVRVPTELAAEMSGGVGARAAVLARGAREGGLQALRAGARAPPGAPAALHRVLRRHGRVRAPVRHPARRLRARASPPRSCAGCSRTCRRSSSRSSRRPPRRGRTAASSRATSRRRSRSAFADELLRAVGYNAEHWRLDPSVHPFARSMAHTDVRLTTRWEPDDLAMAFYSCLHEFGHGLYEAQMSPAHYRTTLADAAGLGTHESQSRLWENLVGRGKPFSRVGPAGHAAPLRRTRSTPGTSGDLYRSVNQVRLSLIRIEADETTYNLHIALRFELELALVEGRLERRRPPGRLGRGHAPAARAGDAVGARGRPAGHPLGHRDDRLLPDVHDREPDGRAAVAGAAHRRAGHRRAPSPSATSRRCASGCATTSTGTAASSTRASCCGGRPAKSCR